LTLLDMTGINGQGPQLGLLIKIICQKCKNPDVQTTLQPS